MTASLFDPHGAYLGPVPCWLTIPEPKRGYRQVVVPVPAGIQLTFEVGRHGNGALKYRMADQETQDHLARMRDREERW